MKIYLLDINKDKCDNLYYYFKNEDVNIICDDLENFLDNTDVSCIVSPANSYGLMDGVYDLAIKNYYGEITALKVQKYILENFYGQQTPGTSFIIPIPNTDKLLIHTPTMMLPEKIKDDRIIYHSMRSTLITALDNNVESIVIPIFGAGTGNVDSNTAARLMYEAYKQVFNKHEEISWPNAQAEVNKITYQKLNRNKYFL